MKRQLFYLLSTLTLISCKKEIPEETFIDFKPNENVIAFKIAEIVTEDYPNKFPDSLLVENFDPKTDTIKFTEKEIYISYLAGINSCTEYGGDVVIKNDSLILKLTPINNMACTSSEIARIIYKIKNSKKIQYKIAKSKASI